jgi:transketolase
MGIGEKSGLEPGPATRDAFGVALQELGEEFPEIVVVDGDVGNSTRTEAFAKSYPERAFNAYDQIRMSVAFPAQNVKLVGSHSGISIGEDGPSQMGIEDVALACSFPGMTVVVPADGISTAKATRGMLEREGPFYLRLGRPAVPKIYNEDAEFTIGRANQVREGDDVTIIANGLMVAMALDAAVTLAEQGIDARVLDMHTVKPIDEQAIAAAARDTQALVVAEEHSANGGLGSAVALTVSRTTPVPIAYVNTGDCYAESGDPDGLLEKYGLTAERIAKAVHGVTG